MKLLDICIVDRPLIMCLKAHEYAKIGDSVTLTCQVSSNPGSTIVWTRNSGERLAEESSTLFTENVSLLNSFA